MNEQNKKINGDMPDVSLLKKELSRETRKNNYRRAILTTLYAIIVAAAAAVLIAVLFMPVFRIYGTSMTPTLTEGDIVVSVSSKTFKAGDLVGFYYGNKLLVKRCVAGPGDVIDIDIDGNVFVNGKYLDEPYITEKAFGECDLELPYQIPDDRWFFMGDHRETSLDSRSASIGSIPTEQVKGKIVFRLWPISNIGAVK